MAARKKNKKNTIADPQLAGNGDAGAMFDETELAAPASALELPASGADLAAAEQELIALPFFDFLARLPMEIWSRTALVYLYRTDPRVRNAGRFKYVDVFNRPFREPDVKAEHGGGGFKAVYTNETTGCMREHFFDCEGAPIFREGQVLQTPAGGPAGAPGAQPGAPAAAAPAPAGNGENQTLMLLREMIRELRPQQQQNGQGSAERSAMDIIADASKQGVALVKENASRAAQADSNATTELITFLKEQAHKAQAPAPVVDPIAQLERAMNIVALVNKSNGQQQSTDPFDQLDKLRNVLGDRFPDLLGGDGSKGVDWMALVKEIGAPLMQLGSRWLDIRAQEAQQLGLRARGPVTIAGRGGVVPAGVQASAEIPAGQQPATQGGDMLGLFDDLARTITVVFHADGDGVHAATAVRRIYPQLVQMFGARLGDLNQVLQISREHPILAEIASAPDYPEFARQFCAEIMHPGSGERAEALEDDAEPGTAPPAANARGAS